MSKRFTVEHIKPDESELLKIGFDKCYALKGLEKHKFLSLKIKPLSSAQANIIKQTALSCGTDAAVHRDVITGEAENSACIISGSISELKLIAKKLSVQPFGLGMLAKEIISAISAEIEPISLKGTIFDWKRPYIMGILNITPDSFSDGGCFFDTAAAFEHAAKLIEDGADIIDIGGESTRPYAQKVDIDVEIGRILPVVEKIREKFPDIPLSIDTRNAKTAKYALEAGVDIINDVSACDWDEKMKEIAKNYDCPLILNHSKGSPENMQDNPAYESVTEEIFDYFEAKIEELVAFGIKKSRLIVDPGIGFGKTAGQNFEILRKIANFKSFNLPVLVGHSRKAFLKKTINSDDNFELDKATNAVSAFLLQAGVNILRVHNVKELKTLVKISEKLF